MRTVIIIQARMTSTRLPGKVLLPLAGKPLLERLIERLHRVKLADAIVVATTTNTTDDPIAKLCVELGEYCYRGSEQDVLSRYAGAASLHMADVVVRITSDCPLIDPELIDRLISAYKAGGSDYVSNMLPPTWPYGMAVEVFSADVLKQAQAEAIQADEREHVTPFIYRHPERYLLRNILNSENLSHHRWTVDTLEDYELVRRIFEALYPAKKNFGLVDLLAIMAENPKWASINKHIQQKQLKSDIQNLNEKTHEL